MQSTNKSFGIVFSIFFFILFIIFVLNHGEINYVFILASIFFLIFSYLYPKIFTPFNYVWIKLGLILGFIISPIIMLIVYLFAVFPTKIFITIMQIDILKKKIDLNTKSYWIKKKKIFSNMDNQF